MGRGLEEGTNNILIDQMCEADSSVKSLKKKESHFFLGQWALSFLGKSGKKGHLVVDLAELVVAWGISLSWQILGVSDDQWPLSNFPPPFGLVYTDLEIVVPGSLSISWMSAKRCYCLCV
jgi:hypothetical protein